MGWMRLCNMQLHGKNSSHSLTSTAIFKGEWSWRIGERDSSKIYFLLRFMAHTLFTVLNKEMESVSCSSSFFTFNLYIYIINAQCRCASGWGAVSKAPIYDDEDYFLALRDFLEGGGPAAFSSEADAAGAEEEEASGVESSFAAGLST